MPDPTINDATKYKEAASKKIDSLTDKASETLHDAAGSAQDFALRMADQGREAADKLSEVGGNLKGAVDKSVREQPIATLAMAVVLGFVLGAVWKA